MSFAGLIFEGLVAAVLVAAAVMCWRLDRRLAALKSGQDGVRGAVAELAQATARAEASVAALKAAGRDAGADLEEQTAKARALADELRLLAERAGGAPARPRRSLREAGIDEPVDPEAKRRHERLRTVR